MSAPVTSQGIHSRLYRIYGYAREHLCSSCFGQALDWAYLYTGDPEFVTPTGTRYSDNEEDYTPLCRKCHRLFDMAQDPERNDPTGKGLGGGPAGGNARAKRMKEDFEFNKKMQEQIRSITSLGGRAVWEKHEAEKREHLRRGLETLNSRIKTDPEFAEKKRRVGRETIKAAQKVRRRCLECGMVSNSPGIDRHQKISSHQGREDV